MFEGDFVILRFGKFLLLQPVFTHASMVQFEADFVFGKKSLNVPAVKLFSKKTKNNFNAFCVFGWFFVFGL